MTSEFKNLLQFIKMTTQFRGVERSIKLLNEKRWENDSEHSYQLALVAWYIAESNNLDLDLNKIIKYALVHDLVEVYAGDTSVKYATKEQVDTKKIREAKAAQTLKDEFSQTLQIHEYIAGYEQKEDAESKFIYALDKLIPDLNLYLDNGYGWKETDSTLSMITEGKTKKVAVDKTIKKYFDELVEILKKDERKFFQK